MKKRYVLWALIFLLLTSMLTGCGGSSKTYAAGANGMAMDAAAPQAAPAAMEEMAMEMETGYYSSASTGSTAPGNNEAKIIYTADLELETTVFDETVEALARLTEDCGGYYESSSINSGGGYRYANYTVRVPVEQYRVFLNQAGQLCHLLYSYEYADDISEMYYDTAGRLATQQTKLARLQELLAQAKNMEDIIAIESAISETEEQIDYLSGSLRRYDALVDYSTVTVSLREVYRLSNVEEPALGFGSRVAAALSSGWRGFVDGIENLVIALAYGWMWLLLLAVIVVVTVLLIRRGRRRARAARAAAMPMPRPGPAPGQERKEE